jgi:hypothetical protein
VACHSTAGAAGVSTKSLWSHTTEPYDAAQRQAHSTAASPLQQSVFHSGTFGVVNGDTNTRSTSASTHATHMSLPLKSCRQQKVILSLSARGRRDMSKSDEDSPLMLSPPRTKGSCHHSQQQIHILGVTSLWLMMPAYYGAVTFVDTCCGQNVSVSYALFSGLVGVTCVVSTLYWGWAPTYRIHDRFGLSLMDVADRTLAGTMFVYLCVLVFWGQPTRSLSILMWAAFPSACLLAYAMNKLMQSKNQLGLATFSHLCFRFIGYWWTHMVLIPPERHATLTVAAITVVQWAHVTLAWGTSLRMPNFRCQRVYWRSCFALLAIISGCIVVRTMLLAG